MIPLAGLLYMLLLTPMGWAGLLCVATVLWAASVLVRAVGC
jgi:hypothetical protein